MNLMLNWSALVSALEIMLYGMIGGFAVMLALYGILTLLCLNKNESTSKKR